MKVKFSHISVVATVHTQRGFAHLAKISTRTTDIIELRVDLLPHPLEFPTHRWQDAGIPVLVTARDPREGGNTTLSTKDRRERLIHALPIASVVDVELRNAIPLLPLVPKRLPRILSSHHFTKTPSVPAMAAAWSRAAALGCNCFKIATRVDTPAQLARLIQLLAKPVRPCPIGVVGMGRLGPISRVVLPACGSILTYGYVDTPQVSGQLPAARLKALVQEFATAR